MPFDTELADNATTGVAAPAPRLTLEAAQAFEAYDRARAAEQQQQASDWVNQGNTSGRALEPWQTENRDAYWQAQQQLADEARRTQEALQQQQQLEQQQQSYTQARQMAQQFANKVTGGGYGALRNAVTTTMQEAPRDIPVAMFGYDPQNPATWQPAVDQAKEIAKRTGGKVVFPGEDQSVGQGFVQFAGQALGAAGNAANILNESPLTQKILGMDAVANVAGNLGQRVGQTIGESVGGPFAPILDRVLPDALRPTNIAGNVGEVIASSLVPTEVWQAALTLLPATKARSIPELLSAITLGDTDALSAFRNAGKKLGENERVDAFLGKLASERGSMTPDDYLKMLENRGGGTLREVLDSEVGHVRGDLSALSNKELRAADISARNNYARAADKLDRFSDELTAEEAQKLARQEELFAGEMDRTAAEIAQRSRRGVWTEPPKKEYGESPDSFATRLKSFLSSEAGFAKIPGEADKAASPISQETIDALKAQRSRLTKMIGKTESNRVVRGGIRDVFTVAERYATDDPKRLALMDELKNKIADLPEVNQKFIQHAMETLPSKAERAAATTAQRASQAARAREALNATDLSPIDRTINAFKAMGGKQAQRFVPIGEKFTPQEVGDLYAQIDKAVADGKLSAITGMNTTSALNLLLTGERLPGVLSESLKPLNLAPHELKNLGKVFGPEFEAAVPRTAAHMSNWEKFFDAANLPRALVTALDFSAAGRQGILLAARNPVEWGKSLKPMLVAMRSEQGLERVGQNIVNNPKYQDALIHGLDITDVGGGFGAEEAFVSHLASRLPFVKGSERGYVAFLDNLRMLTYEKYATRLDSYAEKKGWDIARTDLVKEQVARFLNHATGRGSLPGLERYTPALNAVFFAPKYFASRPQSIWDMVRPGADKFTRQVAFENLGAFVGTGAALLEAARLAGWDVELDPRSSDFGKMRIGNTRIDFWGGYQPIARYIAQIGSGHIKNATTGQMSFANPGKTATRFFRSKLSPLGATIYDFGPGEQTDYQGNDLIIPIKDLIANRGMNKDTGALAWNVFLSKIIPLSIQDAIQGYRAAGNGWAPSQEGIVKGLTAGSISSVGGGISSFEPTEAQNKTIAKTQGADTLKQAGVPYAGSQIDFRQPILAATVPGGSNLTYRQFLAKHFRLSDVADDASLAKMREQYVATGKTTLEQKKLGDEWDAFPPIKDISARSGKTALSFWKANPQLLKQAIDSGVISASKISKAELDILKAAGLQ